MVDEARAARDRGNRYVAEKALDEATRLEPNDPAAWRALGETIQLDRRFAASRPALEQARRLTDGDGDGGLALALGIARAADGDFDGARVELKRATAPGNEVAGAPESAALALGLVDLALGRLGEALEALERAHAELRGRRILVSAALAVALDRAQRPFAATRMLGEALATDPDLRSLEGDPIPLFPEAEALYYRAMARAARGHFADARADLRRFVVDAAGGPWAAHARERLAAMAPVVDGRELDTRATGRAELARDLSAALPEAERCLDPGGASPVPLELTATSVSGPGLRDPERACLARVTAAARKAHLPGAHQATWPLARPSPGALDSGGADRYIEPN